VVLGVGPDPIRTDTRTVKRQGLRVVRVGYRELEARMSRILFEYEIHETGGVRRASEVHELGLFTAEEMLRSFGEAGLEADYDPQGLTGRGIFVAKGAA
jgi:hypothetical protein